MHTNVLHLKKLQKIEPYSKKRFFLQNLLRVKQFLMQAVNGQLEHFRTANQNQVIRKYQKGPIRTCKSRNDQKRGKSVRPSWHSPITGRSETNSIQSPFTSISRWTLFYLTKGFAPRLCLYILTLAAARHMSEAIFPATFVSSTLFPQKANNFSKAL